MPFVDVRDPDTGILLFRYDPQRDLIEIVASRFDKERRRHIQLKRVVDLREYEPRGTIDVAYQQNKDTA